MTNATPSPTGKAAEILDAAEQRMRRGGYDAVSFRDLAADVGIKSASVHYHFPQKTDLGEALVRRYTGRMMQALGAPDDPTERPADRIDRLCAVYQAAAIDPGLICLSCVLGGQVLMLPPPVAEAVTGFFEGVLGWTEAALSAGIPAGTVPPIRADDVVGSLQGAMILAIALKRPQLFADARARLLAALRPAPAAG